MNHLDLKLVCEPVDKMFVMDEQLFKEQGFCVPININKKIYERMMTELQKYLSERKPYITSVRFTNREGGEPRYVQVSENLWKQDDVIWDFIYKEWCVLLRKLIGKKKCFIESYGSVKFLPEGLDGKVITIGDQSGNPIYVECTPKLLEIGQKDSTTLKKGCIWHYNSLGFILKSEEDIYKVEEWANMHNDITKKMIDDFFNSVELLFEVRYELEGAWIINFEHDWKYFYELLEVDKINKKLGII